MQFCRFVRKASGVRVLHILLLGAALHCASAVAQFRPDSWNQPSVPFKVIGNIHYVGTAGLSSFLITTERGHILLDGALPESVPQIEANIAALGFKLRDVKYLLNSHAHFDHSGGLAQLKQDTGAVMVASEGDRSALEGGFYLGSEGRDALKAPPVKVDRVVREGEALELGGTVLTANLTPGHTRGCTSWSMPLAEAGKMLRVLFFCSISVAANRLVDPPQYPGIVADYEKTFARARTLQVDVFLGPHPEFFRMPEKRARLAGLAQQGPNPFVDPQEFAAFIATSEADFRRELASQQARARNAPRTAR
jgi:metallo-beta-lactamase class B